jgi:type IV pilus assembly protein PilQ
MSRATVAGLLAASFLALPVSAAAQDGAANPIINISVTEEARDTVVTISAARTPTFSVFKLEDPVRLFVDVSQGDVSQVSDSILVDNGVLDQVGTLQFRSQGVPVGRIIIGLRQSSTYDVRAVGNQVVVRVDASNRRASTAEAGALALEVSSVREQLRREQELLDRIKSERERDEALRVRERDIRQDAERLRDEALRLKQEAEARAAEASRTARTEEERLAMIRDQTARAEQERKSLEGERRQEAKRLETMKRERELAARERKTLDDELAAEQQKLAATRKAREAEEAHQKALQDLALREQDSLNQARTAREREERLLENLSLARKQEAEARDRLRAEKTEVRNQELAELRSTVAELENGLKAERNASIRDREVRENALKQAQAAVAAKETDLNKAQETTRRLESQVATLRAERDRLAAEQDRLAREAASAVATYEGAMSRLAAEEQRLAEVEARRAEAENRLREMRSEVDSLQGRMEAREAEAARALQENLASREAELATLRAQVAEARAATGRDASQQEARVAQAEARRVQAEEQVRELRREMDALMARTSAAQTAESRTLSEKLASREAELATLRAQVAEARAATGRDASQQEARVAQAEARRVQAEEQVRELRREMDTLMARTSAAQTAESRTLSEKLGSREAELATLRAQVAEARAATGRDASQQEARVAQAEARRVQAEEQVRELRREMDTLMARTSAAQTDEARRLQENLAAREAELATLRTQVGAARQQISRGDDADRQRMELERQLQERENVLSELRAQYDASLDRVRAEVAMAKAQEQEARDREARAASRAEQLEAARAETSRELAGARVRTEELEKELSTRETEVQRLSRELDEAKARGTVSAPVPARALPPTPSIRSIDFQETRDGPTLVVDVEGRPEYKVSVGSSSYEMVMTKVTLPPALARRLDVTAFESHVASISAFTAEDGSVRIIAELDSPIGQNVRAVDGRITWTFTGPSPAGMMAGSAPARREQPPATPRHLAQAQPTRPAQPPAAATSGTAAAQSGDVPYLKPSMVPKRKKYVGRRINLTVKDADIQNVLTFLAREGKVNIVTSEEVRGKVTFHLEDVQWDLALDTVLKAKGLDYVVEQGIYRVAPTVTIQKEYEAQVEKQKKQRELKPVIVRLIPINYADGKEMVSRILSILSPRGAAEIDLRTNTLVVKDTEDYLEAAEELVRRLDQQTPQILIEARIVEARTTFKEDIGIQWGGRFAMSSVFGNETGLVFPSSIGLAGGAEPATPSGGVSLENPNWAVNLPAAVGQGTGGAIGIQLGSIGGAANLSLRLSAAEENGDVKIISSPRISTLDNRKATISQGVSIPISVVSAAGVNTQFFSADLRLDVVPHVTRDGFISLKLDITKNEPDFGNVAANGNPTIQKKEAHTELLIRDGDTTVIGGIYTRNTSKSFKKIPLLGDIPVLGWLFKSRTRMDDRSELLIFITPKIVNREVAL